MPINYTGVTDKRKDAGLLDAEDSTASGVSQSGTDKYGSQFRKDGAGVPPGVTRASDTINSKGPLIPSFWPRKRGKE